MVAQTLPLVQYYSDANFGNAGRTWAFYTGYQGAAALDATGSLAEAEFHPGFMFGHRLAREGEELFTIEHNALGRLDPTDCSRHVAETIADRGTSPELIIVGLSLGGGPAVRLYRHVLEKREVFSRVGLVLISAPGRLHDLKPYRRGLVQAADHFPVLGRVAQLAATAAPSLYIDSQARRELRREPMLSDDVRAGIRDSAAWLRPALHELVTMDGFGPRMEIHGPIMVANLAQPNDHVLYVDRTVASARRTFGLVTSVTFDAPSHGTPWAYPQSYRDLVGRQVAPFMDRAFAPR